MGSPSPTDPLAFAHAPTRAWFEGAFGAPTRAQALGWTPIAQGRSTVLLAPTGSGKTLAAFLCAIDRLAFEPPRVAQESAVAPRTRNQNTSSKKGVRVLYVSPLKALGVDVERNLRAPLAGIASASARLEVPFRVPTVGVRTGDKGVDKHGALAPLTVREALGVVAVRADDATVCPI
jgi:ATP-dependent Lhr-like helicase